MQKLSPVGFGMALGVSGAVFYVGCMIFMATIPHTSVVWISNSMLHGADVTTVMRDGVPLVQSLAGILFTFVGGTIFGALSACIYNFGLKKQTANVEAR